LDQKKSLYARLGGYDAIAAVADNLLPRLMADERLGRFWAHRGEDGILREKQLLIDFLMPQRGRPAAIHRPRHEYRTPGYANQ
jgi:hemoglobin